MEAARLTLTSAIASAYANLVQLTADRACPQPLPLGFQFSSRRDELKIGQPFEACCPNVLIAFGPDVFSLSSSGGEGWGEEALHYVSTSVCFFGNMPFKVGFTAENLLQVPKGPPNDIPEAAACLKTVLA